MVQSGRKRRILKWATVAAIGMMGLYPPWVRTWDGYLDPRTQKEAQISYDEPLSLRTSLGYAWIWSDVGSHEHYEFSRTKRRYRVVEERINAERLIGQILFVILLACIIDRFLEPGPCPECKLRRAEQSGNVFDA